MSLSGTSGIGSLPPVKVNASAQKLLQNLDWGVMAFGEVRKGRWGLLADGFYAELSGSSGLGGALYKSGTLNLQQGLASLAMAYRVIDDRRGFLDVYAGARYNYLGLQMNLETDTAGIGRVSNDITNRMAGRIESGVADHLKAQIDADVESLDRRVKDDALRRFSRRIETDAKRMLEDALRGDRRLSGPLDHRALRNDFDRSRRALAHYLAAETVARRFPTPENKNVADAAKRDFSNALAKDIQDSLPDSGSGSQAWVDPLVGLRAQINFTRWLYFATQADVGGFNVGSQIAWNVMASLGVNFTRNICGELGYRYMYYLGR